MKIFRYIGSKIRLLDYLSPPPKGTKRIVELFAGSMCYGIKYCDLYKVLGIELSERIYNIYDWLLNKPDLDKTLNEFNKYGKEHFDIRECEEFTDVEKDYIRLNCGSVFVGNVNKNVIYTSEKPLSPCVAQTKKILEVAKGIEVLHGSCFDLYTPEDVKEGDLIFIDPPYETSTELYGIKESYTEMLKQYINSLVKTGAPIIFTYGTDAPKLFPEYEWEYVKQEQVTVISKRLNNKVKRDEWVCYFNFNRRKREQYTQSLFEDD
jgi:site-specific DNA-adenine methylase